MFAIRLFVRSRTGIVKNYALMELPGPAWEEWTGGREKGFSDEEVGADCRANITPQIIIAYSSPFLPKGNFE